MEIAIDGLTTPTPPPLEIVNIEGKGRGVVATAPVKCGDYICEYSYSDTYPRSKRAAREEEYSINGEGCMVLEVHTAHGWKCLDATRSHATVGRLLNHAPERSASARAFKPLLVNGVWRVAFLARRDILVGDEITWDYGCPPEGQKWLMKNTRAGMQPGRVVNAHIHSAICCSEICSFETYPKQNIPYCDKFRIFFFQPQVPRHLVPAILQVILAVCCPKC